MRLLGAALLGAVLASCSPPGPFEPQDDRCVAVRSDGGAWVTDEQIERCTLIEFVDFPWGDSQA